MGSTPGESNRTALRTGVGLTDADLRKSASLNRKRRCELATLVAAVVVLIRLVEARDVEDEDEVLLIGDFLSEERVGVGVVDWRYGGRGRRPVTSPAAICWTVGGGVNDVPSDIRIRAAVSSAVEMVNDAEGPGFLLLNDRLTDESTFWAVEEVPGESVEADPDALG